MSTARPRPLWAAYRRCRTRARELSTVAAYRAPVAPAPSVPTSRAQLRHAVDALEDETRALRRQASQVEKLQLTQETTQDLPPYTERELEQFYHGIKTATPPAPTPVALLSAPQKRQRIPKPERREIIQALVARLEAYAVTGTASPASTPVKSRAAQRQHAVSLIDALTPSAPAPALPTGLISRTEFTALFDESLAARDPQAASHILDAARAHGLHVPEAEVHALLHAFASNGDIPSLAGLLQRMEDAGPVPREHLATLVQAHLVRGETHDAVRLLHTFESRHLTLPEPTYRAVLDSLVSPSPTLKQADKALAWDLFTHMRLVAYPVPGVETYNTMIRACADPKDPQPELALDLFTQMVRENAQTPQGETYNVLIRALGKVKTYYYQAFRVLRQMLEVHQATLDVSPPGQGTGYEPTVHTFNALLQGTKRTGDLGRARWILAEMAKIGAFMGDDEAGDPDMLPNEETLVGVFHTYAAYRAVVARADVKVSEARQGGEVASDAPGPMDEMPEEPQQPPQVSLMDIGSPDFVPPYQPQTSYEVFSEATQLFNLVLDNIHSSHGAFSHVRPTPRLINAYLSVGLAHAPLDRAIRSHLGLWHNQRLVPLGVKPNGWTYLFALERCAAARNKSEKRFVADEAVDRLWQGYLRWYAREENAARQAREDGPGVDRYRMDVGLGPREVERCWTAAIRAFALVEDTSRALDMLGEFRDRFPPDAIISAYRPSPRFANKIRFTSPHRTLEDDIPPHILFHDMEILHHRFVRDGNLQGVGKVKWITLGYQLALEKRKSMRMAEKKGGRTTTQGVLGSEMASPGPDAGFAPTTMT